MLAVWLSWATLASNAAAAIAAVWIAVQVHGDGTNRRALWAARTAFGLIALGFAANAIAHAAIIGFAL